jgi:molybdopterin/thiamine biosynthesis adenylyltransferase
VIPVYVLIGAGGTGSILFDCLNRYLNAYHVNREEAHIVAVIDGDELQAHNLDRQLFQGNYVGENKANALVAIYGNETTRAVPEFLSDENVTNRINDGDIVLIAADNFDVRNRIQRHGMTLDNITVINGGNESTDGSLQMWIRRNGENITPPLSFMHDEILRPSPFDPSTLDCQQLATLPGGEQTIIANMMSATQILNAVRTLHEWQEGVQELRWSEIFYDLNTGNAKSFDNRIIEGWQEHDPYAQLADATSPG